MQTELTSIAEQLQDSRRLADDFAARVSQISTKLQELNVSQKSLAEKVDAISTDQMRQIASGVAERFDPALPGEFENQLKGFLSSVNKALDATNSRVVELSDDNIRSVIEASSALKAAAAEIRKLVSDCEEQLVEAFDVSEDAVVRSTESVVETVGSFVSTLGDHLDELSERFESDIRSTVTDLSSRIQQEIEEAVADQLTPAVQDRLDELEGFVTGRLENAIQSLLQTLNEGLERMASEMESGDTEGREQRQLLEDAKAALEDAIPPLESVLGAFQSLARTVGMG